MIVTFYIFNYIIRHIINKRYYIYWHSNCAEEYIHGARHSLILLPTPFHWGSVGAPATSSQTHVKLRSGSHWNGPIMSNAKKNMGDRSQVYDSTWSPQGLGCTFFGSSNLTHKSCGNFVASYGFADCIGTRLVFHNFLYQRNEDKWSNGKKHKVLKMRLLIFIFAAFIRGSLEHQRLLIQLWRSSVTDACKQSANRSLFVFCKKTSNHILKYY